MQISRFASKRPGKNVTNEIIFLTSPNQKPTSLTTFPFYTTAFSHSIQGSFHWLANRIRIRSSS